jgi:hypothetical protein
MVYILKNGNLTSQAGVSLLAWELLFLNNYMIFKASKSIGIHIVVSWVTKS